MKTLEQCKDDVAKRHNYVFEGSQASKEREVAQLYAEGLAKAFLEWYLSGEGELFQFEQSTREGRLITTDELLAEFKASLKYKS